MKYGPEIHMSPFRFLAVFFIVFFITSVFLFVIDFVPEKPASHQKNDTQKAAQAEVHVAELPRRVVIKSIGVDTPIENPDSTSISTLDQALLSGAVRYPESAKLGEDATVYLFGHQSYLPVVKNQAFKAFNDLQKLSAGDVIQVYSDTAIYEYSVRSVQLVTAEDGIVPLVAGSKNLALSTCNSFGDHGERYVIEADYLNRVALN